MLKKHLEKKLIKQVAPIITATRIHKLFLPRFSGLGHILMFHRVLPASRGPRIHNHESLEITVEHLEAVIRYFKRNNYTFLSLDQLPEFLLYARHPERFVIFTFDDGYIDNYLYAAPVFAKYNIPFTIYIATDFPDRRAILWWYYLEEMLLTHNRISFIWKGKSYQYTSYNLDSKEKLFYALRDLFIEAAATDETVSLLQAIYGSAQFDPLEKTETLAMSWQQIRELSSGSLATVGAHTVRHLPLSKMNPDDARNEIIHSRKKIESNIAASVYHFSYPFGSLKEAGEREFRLALECGFRTATTTRFANIHPEHIQNLTALPRITVNSLVSMQVMSLCTSGFLPALRNGFRQVVT